MTATLTPADTAILVRADAIEVGDRAGRRRTHEELRPSRLGLVRRIDHRYIHGGQTQVKLFYEDSDAVDILSPDSRVWLEG